jgi:hypothetical protein
MSLNQLELEIEIELDRGLNHIRLMCWFVTDVNSCIPYYKTRQGVGY